jgi:hypothetical protein
MGICAMRRSWACGMTRRRPRCGGKTNGRFSTKYSLGDDNADVRSEGFRSVPAPTVAEVLPKSVGDDERLVHEAMAAVPLVV